MENRYFFKTCSNCKGKGGDYETDGPCLYCMGSGKIELNWENSYAQDFTNSSQENQ